MPISSNVPQDDPGFSDDPASKKLLFVVDLDLRASSLDVLLDGLFRAKMLSGGPHEISLVCLFSKDSDKALVNQCLTPGEQGAMQLSFVNKDTQQLAPGMMSHVCLNAYLFYQWLKTQPDDFDLIHAFDNDNVLYFALLARKLGMHFTRVRFAHICAAPILYCRDANHEPVDTFTDLAQIFMERQSFTMADFVVSRSNRLLDWLESSGCRVGEQECLVLPPLLPEYDSVPSREQATPGFVYLGNLRSRSDLLMYLDAFKRVLKSCQDNAIALETVNILFVSEKKPSKFAVRSIRNLFDATGVNWTITQASLLEYIERGDMSSKLVLLSPYQPGPSLVAVKLIQAGIPLLGFVDSGIGEFFEESAQSLLIDAHPHKIAQAMMNWLVHGHQAPRASYDVAEVLERYDHWYKGLSKAPVSREDPLIEQKPLVSVCIAHFNRPAELQQALTSVSQLRYPNLEVIVVDDGSTDPKAIRYLQSLEEPGSPFAVRVFTQPNLYLGASRNLAARNARGKYMLFMDDDNLAKPDEIDVLVTAAEHSQADILTCFADAFLKDDEITADSPRNRIVFTGPDIAAGFFRNPYGDSNCLVRKKSFDELGGFSEDYKIGRDDQEFFSRAIFKGYSLLVVPEALYWYKINTSRMRQTQFSQYAGLRRVARPYFEESGLDAHWIDMLRYAQGLSAQKSGVTAKGLRRFAQNNRLRMIAYAFPILYKWLKPLIRRL